MVEFHLTASVSASHCHGYRAISNVISNNCAFLTMTQMSAVEKAYAFQSHSVNMTASSLNCLIIDLSANMLIFLFFIPCAS